MEASVQNNLDNVALTILDDDEGFLSSMGKLLGRLGWQPVCFNDPDEFLSQCRKINPEIVLTDLHMPKMDGLEVIHRLKALCPKADVIVISGETTLSVAVEAMRLGAYDYVSKPIVNPFILQRVLQRTVEKRRLESDRDRLRREVEKNHGWGPIVGRSKEMLKMFETLERISKTDMPVLIQGESGTGKEMIAKEVHKRSLRSSRPFVPINCSALSETLLESELFGHVQGAFTGAAQARKGLFEAAHGGTLFMDELGEMPKSIQPKLLRALQEGEIRPVGSNETKKVNVRIVCATNADLDRMVKKGEFRKDLLYRIGVIRLTIPALKDRIEDLPLLIERFVAKHASNREQPVKLTSSAWDTLYKYEWPGNIRELENVVQKTLAMTSKSDIDFEDLPDDIKRPPSGEEARLLPGYFNLPYARAKKEQLAQFDTAYISHQIKKAGGVVSKAARMAEMDPSNFRRLMTKAGLLAKNKKA